jgi:hypothetical protein
MRDAMIPMRRKKSNQNQNQIDNEGVKDLLHQDAQS